MCVRCARAFILFCRRRQLKWIQITNLFIRIFNLTSFVCSSVGGKWRKRDGRGRTLITFAFQFGLYIHIFTTTTATATFWMRKGWIVLEICEKINGRGKVLKAQASSEQERALTANSQQMLESSNKRRCHSSIQIKVPFTNSIIACARQTNGKQKMEKRKMNERTTDRPNRTERTEPNDNNNNKLNRNSETEDCHLNGTNAHFQFGFTLYFNLPFRRLSDRRTNDGGWSSFGSTIDAANQNESTRPRSKWICLHSVALARSHPIAHSLAVPKTTENDTVRNGAPMYQLISIFWFRRLFFSLSLSRPIAVLGTGFCCALFQFSSEQRILSRSHHRLRNRWLWKPKNLNRILAVEWKWWTQLRSWMAKIPVCVRLSLVRNVTQAMHRPHRAMPSEKLTRWDGWPGILSCTSCRRSWD